jgi:hypothetical protein
MNDEYGNPIEPGLELPKSGSLKTGGLTTGGLTTGGLTKTVHKIVDKATNPASTPHQPVAGCGVTVRKAGTGEIIDFKEDISPAKMFVPAIPQDIIKVPKRHPFEAYWTGLTYQTDAVDVFVARGSLCPGDEKQVGVQITAGDGTLDSIWTLTAALPFLYIKCIFEESGVITSLTFEQESAAISPLFVVGGGGTNSNTWYHPILRYRAGVTTKSTMNTLVGNPFLDSGEERMDGGIVDWTVYQLTNTHLVGQQMCMTAESGIIYTAWKLVPGPGATSGFGA